MKNKKDKFSVLLSRFKKFYSELSMFKSKFSFLVLGYKSGEVNSE